MGEAASGAGASGWFWESPSGSEGWLARHRRDPERRPHDEGRDLAAAGRQADGRPRDDARHVLFVAYETGLAAVAALLEELPSDRRATAILECVDADHRPPMPQHPGLEIVWVDRGDEVPGVTNRLLGPVAASITADDDAPDTAFGAAESRHVSAVRRHLRQELGMPAARVLMTGYWRRQVA